MHSGKDKTECFSTLSTVDGIGKFTWKSNSYCGSIPDAVFCQFMELRSLVDQLDFNSEYIVADAAFYKLRDVYNNVVIPDQTSEKNKEISAIRSLIERAWCGLKKWKIITYFEVHWLGNLSDEVTVMNEMLLQHDKVMTVIMGLYNWFHKPLEPPDNFVNEYGVDYSELIDV